MILEVTVFGAIADNGVVGHKNTIPWTKEQVPRDLPHFMRQTIDGALICGKETFLSMGILKRRKMIVVSKTLKQTEGITVVPTYTDALEKAGHEARLVGIGPEKFPISAIGGFRIWEDALADKSTTRALITRVHHDFEGDTFFPETSLEGYFSLFYQDKWKEKEEEGKFSSTFQIWKRN